MITPTAPIQLNEVSLTDLGFSSPKEALKILSNLEGVENPTFIRNKGFALLVPKHPLLDSDPHKLVQAHVERSHQNSMLAIIWSNQDENSFWALRRCTKGQEFMDYVRSDDSISMSDMVVLVKPA